MRPVLRSNQRSIFKRKSLRKFRCARAQREGGDSALLHHPHPIPPPQGGRGFGSALYLLIELGLKERSSRRVRCTPSPLWGRVGEGGAPSTMPDGELRRFRARAALVEIAARDQ